MWKTFIGDFDWNTKTGVEASDHDTESDLIHYQTGNGLRHTSGPVRLPLSTHYINSGLIESKLRSQVDV